MENLWEKYDGEDKKNNYIVIYVKPTIFDNVTLSSLEGVFVADESNMERDKRLSWFVPQLHFKKDRMSEIEKKYNGKFFPFEK